MKSNVKYLIGLIAAIAIILVVAGLGKNGSPGKYDDFAKCLGEKGVKMYGAYWCPHCINQKEAFGNSWKYVNYVECSLPSRAGQTEFCNTAGIKGYPTWEFANKERIEGEVPLEGLSAKSGCELK